MSTQEARVRAPGDRGPEIPAGFDRTTAELAVLHTRLGAAWHQVNVYCRAGCPVQQARCLVPAEELLRSALKSITDAQEQVKIAGALLGGLGACSPRRSK